MTFLLRLWGTIKRTREPIFRLIRSLIFGAVLVLKHFNFLARPCAHFLIVIMYVEVKLQKIQTYFWHTRWDLSLLTMSPKFLRKISIESHDSRSYDVETT